MADDPRSPPGLIASVIPIAEFSFGVWFNWSRCPPGMQIFPKLTADGTGRAWIRKQDDQRINRYRCIEGQECVHARFLGEVDVERRQSQEQCRHQSHDITRYAFAG